MEQQALEKMESAETVLLKILEDATSLRIGLDEEDSEFDLEFITTKLRKIAIYHERISDLGMQVSKISIEVRNGLTAAVNIARHKEAEYARMGIWLNLATIVATGWRTSSLPLRRIKTFGKDSSL